MSIITAFKDTGKETKTIHFIVMRLILQSQVESTYL